MPTTTIRLPDDLKARVAAAAKHAGTTAHAFILEAIAEKAGQAELRADFDAVAEARYARIAATGKTISWAEMRGYLEARMDGKTAKRPVGRKLAGLKVPRIELAPELAEDFDRILDHLASHEVEDPGQRIGEIIAAVEILEQNPLIGRPLANSKRELVIGRHSHGYVALYRYVPEIDTVFVLALRSPPEAGYTERDPPG